MEAIKSYRIPIEAPSDLIEDYFHMKKRALDAVMGYVKYSSTGKAHLDFGANVRKNLRNELLSYWKLARHYVDSAVNSILGLVKGWIRLYNMGRAKEKPKITKKTVYIKSTLFSYKDGKLKITIEPRKRYLEIYLKKFSYLPEDFNSIGGLTISENGLILTLKKKVKPIDPQDWVSVDVNLTNATLLFGRELKRYDTKKLYHIHRVYELKRQEVQKLSKGKPITSKRLLTKYSKRERNRTKDLLHKLTTTIAKEIANKKYGVILEDLKRIKYRVLKWNNTRNRKLSKWNVRQFQCMLEYKLKWNGLPVKYIDPKNSSRTCPLCSGRMTAYEDRNMRCEKCKIMMNRDVVAVLNLQMWGIGFSPKALYELEREELSRNKSNEVLYIPT